MTKQPLRTLSLLAAFPLAALVPLDAQPTTNPITQFYPGLTQYDWTDSLAWAQVQTTAAVANDGLDDLATVQAEIQALSNAGGGVLFFPAGTYDFSDDLLIWDGVVIRGVQPGDGYVADNLDPNRDPAAPVDEIDNAKSRLFEGALATKFEFPKFVFDKTANGGAGNERRDAFKAIRLNDPFNDSNVGICWVDINRARIEWIQYGEDATGMANSYWSYFGVEWDPALPFTDPSNTWLNIRGTNWVIFGNRINNAARWDNRPGVSPPIKSQPAWSIWPKRITGQIDTFNYSNQIVANNRLMDKHLYDWDDSQPNGQQPGPSIDDFLIEDYVDQNGSAVADDWFSYTRGYGIKMNRSVGLDGNDIPYTPDRFPLLYRKGITCRDNWTFVTRRVGIYVGGQACEVIGNYRTDKSWNLDGDKRKQAWITPDGKKFDTNNGRTQENRGIDITGFDIITHKNYMLCFRTKSRDTPYLSTCGEGFLHQEVGGGSPVYRWRVTDNFFSGYLGIYRSREIRGIEILRNEIPSGIPDQPLTAAIFVEADTNYGEFNMADVLIADNIAGLKDNKGRTLIAKGSEGVDNIVVTNNDFGNGNLLISDGVQLVSNSNVGSVETVPTTTYDALPTIDGTPADPVTVAPGATVTLQIQAEDNGGAPAGVSIFEEVVEIGDAVQVTPPNGYSYDLVAPTEPGLYYYFVRVEGTPESTYSTPICLVVSTESTVTAPVLLIHMGTGNQVVVSFESEAGKNYDLYQGLEVDQMTYSETITGDGSLIERSFGIAHPREFFQIDVQE